MCRGLCSGCRPLAGRVTNVQVGRNTRQEAVTGKNKLGR